MERKKRIEKQMKKIRASNIKNRAIENETRKLKEEALKMVEKIKPIRNPSHSPGSFVHIEIVDHVEVDQEIQYKYKDWTRLAKVIGKESRPNLQILGVSEMAYENVDVFKVKENRLYRA